MTSAEHAAHMARIEERLRLGLEVTQADWDRAAALFDDADSEEMVPPDPEPARPPARLSAGLGQLIREAFRDIEREDSPDDLKDR